MLESEERFRNVTNSSGDWIWETNRNGMYTYCSYAVKEILGYTPHEVVGKKYFYDFAFLQDKEILKAQALKAVQEQQSCIREIARRRHKNGREVILDIRGFAIRDAKGHIIGYRGVDRDITELKKTEQMIEESRKALESVNKDLAANEKMLLEMIKDIETTNRQLTATQEQLIQSEKMASVGVLASGVAHEIKNPLAIIVQGMERIEKILTQTSNDGIQYIAMVKNAAVKANRVIDALLKFSRSSRLEVKQFSIHEAIDAALMLIENKAKLSNIRICRYYTSERFLINGDNILLEQVFFDLFTNAVNAMPNGGELIVTTCLEKIQADGQREQRLFIDVKDTGVGIAPEHIPRIFDSFFTTKEPGQGTGLGLSTAYLILQRHQGTIKVDSQFGVGTTFTIALPVFSFEKIHAGGN